MSSKSLPRWGEMAKVLAKFGAEVWLTLLAVAWVAFLASRSLGGRVPEPIYWILVALSTTSFAVLVVAGTVWLIAEFRAGLRDAR